MAADMAGFFNFIGDLLSDFVRNECVVQECPLQMEKKAGAILIPATYFGRIFCPGLIWSASTDLVR